MADKKKTKGWNFAEMQDSLVKDTEQKIEQGFREIAEQSSEAAVAQQQTQQAAQQTLEPVREITAPAGRTEGAVPAVATAKVIQEPTQNINIPIPTSQHVRLKVISATSRQTMKDMVVQAIGLWLDVQEGKKVVKNG